MSSLDYSSASKKIGEQLINYLVLVFVSVISSGVSFYFVGKDNDVIISMVALLISLILLVKTINIKRKLASTFYIITILIASVIILYLYFMNNGIFDTKALDGNMGAFVVLITITSQVILAFLVLVFKIIYNANKYKEDQELTIKIENFIKDKSIKECPFIINGDEKLKVEPIGKVGYAIILVWALFCLIGSIASFSIGPLVIGMFVGAAMGWFFGIIYSFFPQYSRDLKRIEVIDEYFKRRFDILKEFDTDKHEKLDTFSIKEQKSYDDIMFDIYMKAHKLNADAIVLNDYKYSSLAKKSSVHLTGTIIKYK